MSRKPATTEVAAIAEARSAIRPVAARIHASRPLAAMRVPFWEALGRRANVRGPPLIEWLDRKTAEIIKPDAASLKKKPPFKSTDFKTSEDMVNYIKDKRSAKVLPTYDDKEG